VITTYPKQGKIMANNKSAKKRILVTAKKTERNRYYRTRIKNIVKAVHEAVEASDKAAATTAFATANKSIHSLVSKGFLKKTTAARKVSRLHKMINKLEA
jgi:small subunit ribosomal protein S20